MDSLGTAISVALQYGVPIESLVSKFAYQRFEPQGITTNRDIPFAKSLVDYIFQWMGMQFIEGYREANLPSRSTTPNPTSEIHKKPTTVKEDTRWSTDSTDTTRPTSATTPSICGITPRVETEKEKSDPLETITAKRQVTIQTARVSVDGLETEELTMQQSSSLSQSMASMQGDAPACPECGAITVRSGTCYKCMNCGESLGCS